MSHPLSDNDKQRIKLEESYRKEVQEGLRSKKDSRRDFLSSPFMIAAITIAAAAAGSVITQYADYVSKSWKESQEHKERSERIAREISFRCALFAEEKATIDKARILNGELPKAVAYDEFQGAKLYPLILELEPLISGADQKKATASLANKCCTDFNSLDDAKLNEIATDAQSIARGILPK